ncbi:hypothetical protein LTR95_011178 [Oleoguttula sp. CCFEE 5521]
MAQHPYILRQLRVLELHYPKDKYRDLELAPGGGTHEAQRWLDEQFKSGYQANRLNIERSLATQLTTILTHLARQDVLVGIRTVQLQSHICYVDEKSPSDSVFPMGYKELNMAFRDLSGCDIEGTCDQEDGEFATDTRVLLSAIQNARYTPTGLVLGWDDNYEWAECSNFTSPTSANANRGAAETLAGLTSLSVALKTSRDDHARDFVQFTDWLWEATALQHLRLTISRQYFWCLEWSREEDADLLAISLASRQLQTLAIKGASFHACTINQMLTTQAGSLRRLALIACDMGEEAHWQQVFTTMQENLALTSLLFVAGSHRYGDIDHHAPFDGPEVRHWILRGA